MNAFTIESAIEHSSDGILISDNQGNVTYINPAYENITGLRKEQILGKSLKELKDNNIINEAVSLSVLESKSSISVMHHYVTGKSALTTANPIYSNDEMIGVVCNTRNISELINLKNALNESRMLTNKYSLEIKRLREQVNQNEGFIYRSKVMEDMIDLAAKAAAFDSTILIQGESGTGKEVLSKFIHNESPRKDEPFVKINCAAIPNELFESELFGYAEGSFTGASRQGKVGMFELANNGTILLDEISELPLLVQSKLLRVLQEQEIYKVGAKTPTKLNVRVLAATNKDLKKESAEGRFREDLFFRINVIPITIPPLRNRPDDVEYLIDFFLEKLNIKYRRTMVMSHDAKQALMDHSWPGNIRELENLVEYLFIMNPHDVIDFSQLPPAVIMEHLKKSTNSCCAETESNLECLVNLYEKNLIQSTLKNFRSLRQASVSLGIHYSTLSRKVKKYGLENQFVE